MSARILVIHDEPARREQLRLVLEPVHEVTLCGGVRQCMTLLKNAENTVLAGSPFDLILSAVHLDSDDDLTVFDLLKWTKGNIQIKNVPFVLLDLQPSRPAKTLTDAIRGAASSFGASAYLIVDDLDGPLFLSQLDAYIRPEQRANAPKETNGMELLKPPIQSGARDENA